MADNVFTQYINDGGKFQSRSLNDIPVGNKYLAYPEGLGGTPIRNSTPSQTIPFTLFMPYKRAAKLAGFYSTGTNPDQLFTDLPQPTYAIALPTPTSALKTDYKATYSSFDVGQALGAAGGELANAAEGAIGILKAPRSLDEAAKAAGTGAGGIFGLVGSMAKITAMSAIGSALADAGGSKEIVNVFAGQANNPYTENVFKNIEFRNHTFSYVFMPRSLNESLIIDDIITVFKYAMHPQPGTGVLGSGFFDFPFEFQITHSIQDTTFTLLPSVLESLEVDYSGGADSPKLLMPQSNKQQYPAKITLNMTFKEMVLLSRNRITGDKTRTGQIITQSLTDIEGTAPTGLRFRF